MKLGIMQPYFYPYLGYFSLIKHTDNWIVFDPVQYIERGWVNRNRIIHPTKPEATYITVPVRKHSRDILIKDILIDTNSPFQEHILGQMEAAYKKRAPYYRQVMSMLEETFSQRFTDIVSLNIYAMEQVCNYLNIPFKYDVFSQMNLDIDDVGAPGEWALNISSAVGATEYINPPGGIGLFDAKKFRKKNIELSFLKIHLTPYNQRKSSFIEGLSILDAMMFCDPVQLNKMLDNFEIIKKDNSI